MCKNSVGTFIVKGKNQDYEFCLHEIVISKINIDITGRFDKNRTLLPFGSGPFCKFGVDEHINDIGIYCFLENNVLKYLGETINPFQQRINNGYGNISPYNCYEKDDDHHGGQRTNCRVNHHINEALTQNKEVLVGFHVMNDAEPNAIKALETELIAVNQPEWNKQK